MDSSEVDDTMESIKHKCGAEGGDRNHSLAMSKEHMTKIFAWSEKICPEASVNQKSTSKEEHMLKAKHAAFRAFSSTAWTVWSRHVVRSSWCLI